MVDPLSSRTVFRATRARRAGWGALALLALALVALLAYRVSSRVGTEQLRVSASHQLDVLAAAIDSEVTRHAAIPGAIQLNAAVLGLLRAPGSDPAAANRFLEQLNHQLGGPALFVMNTAGRVIASSDWIFSDNLLGANLAGMPFFASAVRGFPSRHFAIDPIRREPGYYFALPIRDEAAGWRVIGVAVVQSGLHALERRWLAQEAPAIIVDSNGIVLVASPPEWRYMSLQPLAGETVVDLARQQFADLPVGHQSLGLALSDAEAGVVVRLPAHLRDEAAALPDGRPYLALARHLPQTAWRIVVFADLRPVATDAATHAALAMAALGCVLLGGLYLVQRRRLARSRDEARRLLETSHQALEREVVRRTADLSEAVANLRHEVGERQRAELTLRAAQDELVQAAKLAVVGQMAAGITHELSQPLGAIRTLSENAAEFLRRGDHDTALRNLALVGQLSEQMGGIIGPLKTFARKSPAVPAAVDVAHALDAALFLFDPRLRKAGVTVNRKFGPKKWIAWCDANRLQQVLVNLIGNALDALAGHPAPVLTFAVAQPAPGRLALTVSDNGPGLGGEAGQRLFEPFFTTKQPGEGLGLGLAISRDILRDFGGDLLAGDAPGGGACFTVFLPEPIFPETAP